MIDAWSRDAWVGWLRHLLVAASDWRLPCFVQRFLECVRLNVPVRWGGAGCCGILKSINRPRIS